VSTVLDLTLAINRYDHVRDLVDGTVPVEGVALRCLSFSVEEIFFRFSRFREWDVSEMSLAKYTSLRAGGDDSLTAIPVFPSRVFRHSAIFVRDGGAIAKPEDLAGGRVGVPEWTQTATVYARGLLAHEYGVALEGVEWFQGGVNEPGRVEGIAIDLPPEISYTAVPDRSLNDMLLAGDLDAFISAHPPAGFKRGIVRLIDDPAVEQEHYRRTRVFPIMHVIALRRDVYDAHRWVAMNLFTAFEEAKRRSVQRILDPNASMVPLPQGHFAAAWTQNVFGEDLWPYGLEPNRPTLETFLAWAAEQGVNARRLPPEELFAPETLQRFRI
jgi:4,5-dihydroxyphthalate decarboxylase